MIKNVSGNRDGNAQNKDSDKLLQENLILKRIILELKAQNIQKEYGKKLNVPKYYNENNLDKNYQKANKLFDDLEQIMYTIGSDKKENGAKNNNNNINNKSNDKKLNDIKLNDKKLNEKKLNDKKEEKKIDLNNIANKNKLKEDIKVKEKQNKIINKNNNKMNNNNIDLEINDNEKEKELMTKKEKIQKYNSLNIYDDNDEEDEKDNDDFFDNPQHQQIYENFKKDYESRGLKFGKKEFMEILLKAQQEKLGVGEDDDDDDDEPF